MEALTKRKRTQVAAVIDESSSMTHLRSAVVRGYADYLRTLQETPAQMRLSLTLFDDDVREVEAGVPASIATTLEQVYHPEQGGSTALYDAVGTVIERLDELAEQRDRVLVIIMTDGEDNRSVSYDLRAVRALIQEREATGRWSFIFLGVDLKTGQRMGVNHVRQLTATTEGVRAALAEVTADARQFLLTDGQ